MANEHYEAVLEDLERQRAELDAAINAIRRLSGAGGIGSTAQVGSPTLIQRSGTGQMREDEFFGLSIVTAAKKYLGIVRKPTAAPVIAREIKAHGLLNNSKGFAGTVYSLLYRESEKPNGGVIKMPDNKWALSEWYPGMKRQRGKASENGDGDATEPDDDSSES